MLANIITDTNIARIGIRCVAFNDPQTVYVSTDEYDADDHLVSRALYIFTGDTWVRHGGMSDSQYMTSVGFNRDSGSPIMSGGDLASDGRILTLYMYDGGGTLTLWLHNAEDFRIDVVDSRPVLIRETANVDLDVLARLRFADDEYVIALEKYRPGSGKYAKFDTVLLKCEPRHRQTFALVATAMSAIGVEYDALVQALDAGTGSMQTVERRYVSTLTRAMAYYREKENTFFSDDMMLVRTDAVHNAIQALLRAAGVIE